jgi:hypothetical protein
MSIFSDYKSGAMSDDEYNFECGRMNRKDRSERDREYDEFDDDEEDEDESEKPTRA